MFLPVLGFHRFLSRWGLSPLPVLWRGWPFAVSSVHWTYSVVVLISQKAGVVSTFVLICYIFHNQVFSLSLVLTQVFVSLLL